MSGQQIAVIVGCVVAVIWFNVWLYLLHKIEREIFAHIGIIRKDMRECEEMFRNAAKRDDAYLIRLQETLDNHGREGWQQ